MSKLALPTVATVSVGPDTVDRPLTRLPRFEQQGCWNRLTSAATVAECQQPFTGGQNDLGATSSLGLSQVMTMSDLIVGIATRDVRKA